jgi:hypothetical protein
VNVSLTSGIRLVVCSAWVFAGLVIGGHAQTLSLIGLEQFQDYQQTGPSAASGPSGYHFNLAIGGSNLSSLDVSLTPPSTTLIGPATLAPSDSSVSPYYIGPYTSSSFNDSGKPVLANGSYVIGVGPHGNAANTFSTSTLNFTGNLYSSAIPLVNGAGMTWSGGNLTLDATVGNTFNFNTATSGFSTTGYPTGTTTSFGGSVTFLIYDAQGHPVFGNSSTAFNSDAALTSFNLPAFSLTSGASYDATLEFNVIVAADQSGAIHSVYGATTYALYGVQTHLTLVAVPEPADIAALLAAASFLAVPLRAIRRKRKLAA